MLYQINVARSYANGVFQSSGSQAGGIDYATKNITKLQYGLLDPQKNDLFYTPFSKTFWKNSSLIYINKFCIT